MRSRRPCMRSRISSTPWSLRATTNLEFYLDKSRRSWLRLEVPCLEMSDCRPRRCWPVHVGSSTVETTRKSGSLEGAKGKKSVESLPLQFFGKAKKSMDAFSAEGCFSAPGQPPMPWDFPKRPCHRGFGNVDAMGMLGTLGGIGPVETPMAWEPVSNRDFSIWDNLESQIETDLIWDFSIRDKSHRGTIREIISNFAACVAHRGCVVVKLGTVGRAGIHRTARSLPGETAYGRRMVGEFSMIPGMGIRRFDSKSIVD